MLSRHSFPTLRLLGPIATAHSMGASAEGSGWAFVLGTHPLCRFSRLDSLGCRSERCLVAEHVCMAAHGTSDRQSRPETRDFGAGRNADCECCCESTKYSNLPTRVADTPSSPAYPRNFARLRRRLLQKSGGSNYFCLVSLGTIRCKDTLLLCCFWKIVSHIDQIRAHQTRIHVLISRQAHVQATRRHHRHG